MSNEIPPNPLSPEERLAQLSSDQQKPLALLDTDEKKLVGEAILFVDAIRRAKGERSPILLASDGVIGSRNAPDEKVTEVPTEEAGKLRDAERAFNIAIETSFGGAGHTQQSFTQRRDGAMEKAYECIGF